MEADFLGGPLISPSLEAPVSFNQAPPVPLNWGWGRRRLDPVIYHRIKTQDHQLIIGESERPGGTYPSLSKFTEEEWAQESLLVSGAPDLCRVQAKEWRLLSGSLCDHQYH